MSDWGRIGATEVPEIRVYRSGALTTGASTTYVNLPWDAESSAPSKLGFVHSNITDPELITCDDTGAYVLMGTIRVAGGTWAEIRASVEIDGIAVYTTTMGASGGLLGLGLTTEPSALVLSCILWPTAGQSVRVRVASVGQANVAITAGETNTWLAMRRI